MKGSQYGTEYIESATAEYLESVKDIVVEEYLKGETEDTICHSYRVPKHHMMVILKTAGVFQSKERKKALKEKVQMDRIKDKRAKELFRYYCKKWPHYREIEPHSPFWTRFCIINISGDRLELIFFKETIMDELSDIVGYEVRAIRKEIKKSKIMHTVYIPFDDLTNQMMKKIIKIGRKS